MEVGDFPLPGSCGKVGTSCLSWYPRALSALGRPAVEEGVYFPCLSAMDLWAEFTQLGT